MLSNNKKTNHLEHTMSYSVHVISCILLTTPDMVLQSLFYGSGSWYSGNLKLFAYIQTDNDSTDLNPILISKRFVNKLQWWE